MRAALVAVVLCGACASGRTHDAIDATGGDGDAMELDAADDGGGDDAPAIDAAMIDGAAIDGAVTDAAMIDARPIDAPAIDAPTDAAIDAAPCTPTWHDVLGNGGFDTNVVPWTVASTTSNPILRPSASMPFAAQAGGFAAEFGADNNATDVLVQTVTIPAAATGLRVRGYQCFVTEDFTGATDTFAVTLETPAGQILEPLLTTDNSAVAPLCIWTPFTWTSVGAHAGATVVLRLRGRTNLVFLTRFVVDTMSLEWLGC